MVIQPADGIRWAGDNGFLCVVDENKGCEYRLAGFEAALWSWLVLAYDYNKVGRFAQVWLGVPLSEAENKVRNVIQEWLSGGLVKTRPEGDGHG